MVSCVRREGVILANGYGAGTGQIWLDDVDCRGNESSIVSCDHRGWAKHNCRHHEDVSIACTGNSIGRPTVLTFTVSLSLYRVNQQCCCQ